MSTISLENNCTKLQRRFHKSESFVINSTWIIKEGFAYTRTLTEVGDYQILGVWGKGDILVNLSKSFTTYDIKAITDVVIEEVTLNDLSKESLLFSLQKSHEFLQIIRVRFIKDRLVELMNWLANNYGLRLSENESKLNFKLTQDEISYALNTTRVTITRNLSELDKQGRLKVESRGGAMFITSGE